MNEGGTPAGNSTMIAGLHPQVTHMLRERRTSIRACTSRSTHSACLVTNLALMVTPGHHPTVSHPTVSHPTVSQAMALATALRDAGKKVDMVLQPKKTKWLFKHADKLDAKYVVLLARRRRQSKASYASSTVAAAHA